ncbi:5,10-methylene tetrahydromethanopterin reductase [Streptomyces hygroscopicus]|nr:5,10-methylene tetrahydromethanopterin reductase [Streptomyces hygroscopicus]
MPIPVLFGAIWPERDHTRQIRAFAAEVVPAVREALARKT